MVTDQRAEAIEVVRATIAGCCRSDIGEVTLATAIVDALFERFPPQSPAERDDRSPA